MLAELRLTTAQQRTIGQNLPSDLYLCIQPTYNPTVARRAVTRPLQRVQITAVIRAFGSPSAFNFFCTPGMSRGE
jgi:hypothetical protein